MLLWLPNVLLEKKRLFWVLWAAVTAAHIFFVIGYGLASRRAPLVIHVSRHMLRTNQAIKILPFVRRTGQLERVFKRPAVVRRAAKKPVIVVSAKVRSKKAVIATRKNNTRTALAEKVQKKIVQVKKHGTDKKKKPEKKKVEKTVLAQEHQQELLNKEKRELKSEPSNQTIAQPPAVESVTTKSVETKEEISVSAMEPVAQDVLPEQTTSQQLDVDMTAAVDNDQSPIELGQEEYDALQMYRVIHDELSHQWHPPAGLHPKRGCIVLVSLAAHGAVAQLQIEQSSGMLAYDIAARMAVSKTKFPASVWGQQIRLHF
jgi:outer membrane biosynthesis protein TonB